MIKELMCKSFVAVNQILFAGAFLTINLVGIAFLGVVGYYLVF